jgi:hypothetical protein
MPKTPRTAAADAASAAPPTSRLLPPIDLLNTDEAAAVVAILREAVDLGAAERALRQRFPQWNLARRLAGLRQAQNSIFNTWAKNPARKQREALVRGHAGEVHKEGRPESGS